MIFLDNELLNNEAEEAINEKAEEIEEAVEEASAEITEETAAETEPEEAEAVSEEPADEEETDEADAAEEEIIGDGAESEEEEDEEIDADELCPHCGKKRRKEGCDYCAKCEKELVKTKIPAFGFLVAAAALAVSLFAFVLTVMLSTPALSAAQGDAFKAKNNWFSAYGEYSKVDEQLNEIKTTLGEQSPVAMFLQSGCNLKLKTFKCVAKVYDPLQANQYSSYVFDSSKQKFLEKDKFCKEISKIYDEYQSTSEAISGSLQKLYAADETNSLTPEDGKEIIAGLEKHRDGKGVNNVFLDFFIYNVAGYCSMGDEEVNKYLDNLHKTAQAGDRDYYWLYYDSYISELMSAGKYDEAMPLIEHQMEQDASDFDPANQRLRIYIANGDMDGAEKFVEKFCAVNKSSDGSDSDSNYVMRIILHRVKGEYEQATALAEEANGIFTAPEFSRQLALIDLLNGEYDSAYENAFAAEDMAYYLASYYGDSSAYSTELTNTTYLAAYYADKYGKKNTENAQYLEEFLASYKGNEPGGVVGDIISGKVKLEDVLTKGVCDLI